MGKRAAVAPIPRYSNYGSGLQEIKIWQYLSFSPCIIDDASPTVWLVVIFCVVTLLNVDNFHIFASQHNCRVRVNVVISLRQRTPGLSCHTWVNAAKNVIISMTNVGINNTTL